MHHPLFALRAALLLACGATTSLWAQDTPPVTVTAAYTMENEEYRDTSGTNTRQIGLTELGLLFHTIQGLQKIELDARLVNYQYLSGTGQNHTEANYTAGWQWAVTPRLRGNLDASQQEAPRAETINGDSNVPNRQTQTHYRADVEYEVDGPWHVVAGASRDQHASQYVTTSSTDTRSDSRDVGLRYDFATGSWIKLSLKSIDGSYQTASSATDDSYQQQEQELRMRWSLSVASTMDLYITQVDRVHQVNAQLDFRGNNYGANASWELSGRSTLVLGYAHALAVVVVPAPGWFTTQDSLSWGLNWQTSSRTQLRLRQALGRLDYRGPSAGVSSNYLDSSHDTSLTLAWTPGKQWQISAAVQRQAHGSGLAGQDYSNQIVSLTAQFSY
jgi:hypothetical protein